MSRSIEIHVTKKKGLAHRHLAEAVAVKRRQMYSAEEAVPGSIPPAFQRVLNAAATAAKPLISAAGRGDQVEVSISLVETPHGGWQCSILVDVPVPTEPEG